MKYLADVILHGADILEFQESPQFNHYTFRIDYKAKKRMNEVLGTTFKAVYREANKIGELAKNGMDLDSETIYCIRADGEVIRFTNSEWGGIEVIKEGDPV